MSTIGIKQVVITERKLTARVGAKGLMVESFQHSPENIIDKQYKSMLGTRMSVLLLVDYAYFHAWFHRHKHHAKRP